MDKEIKKPVKVHLFGQCRLVWFYDNRIMLFVKQNHRKPFSEGFIRQINSITRLEFRVPESMDKTPWNEFTIYSEGLKTPEDVQNFFQSPNKEKPLTMARKNRKPETVTKLKWDDFNLPPQDAQAKATVPKNEKPGKNKKQKPFRRHTQRSGYCATK